MLSQVDKEETSAPSRLWGTTNTKLQFLEGLAFMVKREEFRWGFARTTDGRSFKRWRAIS